MTLTEIKDKAEKQRTELFNKVGLFFAFSNEQFKENKTPLKEGEKYVSIGSGGYLPKGNLDELINGMKAIEKEKNKTIKKSKLEDKEILYEIYNHECYYTHDLTDVYKLFEGVYSQEQINKVFQKNIYKNK